MLTPESAKAMHIDECEFDDHHVEVAARIVL